MLSPKDRPPPVSLPRSCARKAWHASYNVRVARALPALTLSDLMESEPSLGLLEVRRLHADGFDRKEAAALLRLALPDLKPKLASKYITKLYGPAWVKGSTRGSKPPCFHLTTPPPELLTSEETRRAEVAARRRSLAASNSSTSASSCSGAIATEVRADNRSVSRWCAAPRTPSPPRGRVDRVRHADFCGGVDVASGDAPRPGPCHDAPRRPPSPRGVLSVGLRGERLAPYGRARGMRVTFAEGGVLKGAPRGISQLQLPYSRVCWWPTAALAEFAKRDEEIAIGAGPLAGCWQCGRRECECDLLLCEN